MMAIHTRLATDEEQSRWNEFVFSVSQGSFLQSWAWGQVQVSHDMQIWRYIGEREGNIVFVALVIKHRLPLGLSWLYIPYGPIAAKGTPLEHALQSLLPELKILAKKESAAFIRIDPKIAADNASSLQEHGWRKAPREVQPQDTMVLDLHLSEEELLANMHHKTRYNIRLAERKGVTVRFSTRTEDIGVFCALARDVANRAAFRFHDDRYYEKLVEILSASGMAEVAIAEHEGEALAAHIMFYAGNTATYGHGASSSVKRSLMAPAFLFWKTIQRAKEKGLAVYDMYGVAPKGADDSHPWAGVTRMKEGFGGQRVSYVGAHDFVLRPLLYTAIHTARSVRSLMRKK